MPADKALEEDALRVECAENTDVSTSANIRTVLIQGPTVEAPIGPCGALTPKNNVVYVLLRKASETWM